MLSTLACFLCVTSLGSSSVLRHQDPLLQSVPATAPADDSFNNGAALLIGEPAASNDTPPAVYGARPIDLPFNRLYHGNIKFFPAGQLNTKDVHTDSWIAPTGHGTDSATQSACGIPDNAYYNSKVAIHPYFLKYADLSRYCMQDVCISFWKEDGSSDMMLKVTDVCSTDPSDPTHCATPADIKIDRAKAQVMEGFANSPISSIESLIGHEYPEKVWWFFMKCWDDGLPQPAYQSKNWFATPPLANNLKWAQDTAMEQYKNNQAAYAAKGWPTYPNGAYNPKRDDTTSPPISDWVYGQEPSYIPIAGGKGWGNGGGSGVSPASNSTSPANSTTTPQQTGEGSSGGQASLQIAGTGSIVGNDTKANNTKDDECDAEL